MVVRRAIQHHDDPINGSQQGWHGVAAVAVIVEVVIVALAAMRMIMIFWKSLSTRGGRETD